MHAPLIMLQMLTCQKHSG